MKIAPTAKSLPRLLRSGAAERALPIGRSAAAIALFAFCLWVGVSLWVRLNPAQEITLPTAASYEPYLDDYVVYWVVGRLVLEGEAGDIYDLEAIGAAEALAVDQPQDEILVLPYYNPPFIAVLIAPLALLPLKTSALIFTGLMLAALAIALRLLLRHMESPLEVALWTACVLSSLPFFYAVGHGQFSFLLLLIFTAAYLFFKRGSDGFGGATLALLLMKPQLLVLPLLVLAIKRRHSALLGFAAGAAGLGLASILISGPTFLIEYPQLLINASRWDDEGGILTWAMYGWNGFFRGIVGPDSYDFVAFLHLAASLGTVGLCLCAWRDDWRPNSPDFDVRFSVVVLGVLLTSPHLYGQDLLIAVLPLVLLYSRWKDTHGRLIVGVIALTSWLLLYFHFSILSSTSVNFVTLTMFATMLFAATRVTSRARSTARMPGRAFSSTSKEALPDVS